MADKERIFPNDTFPFTIEVRRRDPENPNNPDGLPATPVEAYARLFDKGLGAFIEIGGVGETTAPAAIDSQLGTTSRDRGALVSFTVTSEFTETPSNYTLYITCVFSDGVILTEDKTFQVLEYR